MKVIDSMTGNLSKRQKLDQLRSQMINERASFIAHWRDLSDYFQPRRARFFTSDNNKGDRRNNKIIDSTGYLAIRTLKAGMMGGITSPARPWMKLDVEDPKLSESDAVKEWLHTVTERMLTVFLRSNLYNALPILYGDMGTFGTAAMLVEEDLDQVFRASVFPIGSFCIAVNERGQVDTFEREFQMTVAQMIKKFGKHKPNGMIDWDNFNWENFSSVVRMAVERNQLQQKLDVVHIICPNDEYNEKAFDHKGKRFSSTYFERGMATTDQSYGPGDSEKFLRESGYDKFPVLGPRWEVAGEDIYGTDCPAMICLGDNKALQLMQRRKAQAIEKKVNPPMTGPTSLRNVKTSILPGDITYADVRDGQQGFRPVHEIRFDITELSEDIRDNQRRIDKSCYADLFLMMQQDERVQPATATEINEKHEEKLLALGPMLEGLNQDVLDPLIDLVFSFMVKQRMIPPAPKELHGMPLRVRYISIMAQAQKLLGISSSERFIQFAQSLINIIPSSADVINADEMLISYADQTSIAPKVVRSPEELAKIRDDRAKQQAQQQRMAQAQQAASAQKDLSQTNLDGNNALTRLMQSGQAGNAVPQQ